MIPITKLSGRLGNQMFQFAYIYAQMKRGRIVDVYVQNNEFFDDFKEEIRTLYGDGLGNIDKIAIHVRRGDYVNNSFYVDLTKTDYYQRAMALFLGENFLVFSDDIDWCKEQDIFKGCSFSEGHDEIKDLNIMASCKGVITANSSYSWWGAYLSDGKVIAPLAWYSDGIERTKCPKEWLRI
jgi:hypothetical protein